MSLESVGLIGTLTLLALFLGADLFLLITGKYTLNLLGDPTLLDTLGHLHQPSGLRITTAFIILLAGAGILNCVPHTRTEVYLLRIGAGTLVAYAVLVLLGVALVGHETTEVLMIKTNASRVWELLLWPRAALALVSFWSFLHYAMNPKV